MSAAIINEGSCLASAVGNPKFEDLNKQSEIKVREYYEKAGQALEDVTRSALESIRREVEAELQSNLTQAFVSQLNFNGEVPNYSPVNDSNRQQVQVQVEWLQKIGNQVGANVTKAATSDAARVGSGFLRSTEVASSSLHQFVYEAGKLIGVKFKPWQAVGIAKNIGNAAKFLGPALAVISVISVGMELHKMHEEHKNEQKKADVRRDIISTFKKIAVDLERQIEEQCQEFESQVYGQLEKNISEARQQTESAMAASNAEIRQIAAIRKGLEAIILEVQHTAMSSVL
jgi:hypothetical protein